MIQVSTTDLNDIVLEQLNSNPVLEVDSSPDKPAETPASSAEVDPAPTADAPEPSEAIDLNDRLLDEKRQALADLDAEWGGDSYAANGSSGSRGSDDQDKYDYAFDAIVAEDSLSQHLLQQLAVF